MATMRAILSTLALLLANVGWCQLDVYKTYSDYISRHATSYGDVDIKKWKGKENTILVFGKKGKDDVEVECSGIWGFGYKEVLFRISKDSKYFVERSEVQIGVPMMVLYLGDLAYYQDGFGALDAMKHGRQEIVLSGMCATISKDLDSDMALVPYVAKRWTDEQILLLLNAYPELKDLVGDLEVFKKEDRFSMGSFSYDIMTTYVRSFILNHKEPGN